MNKRFFYKMYTSGEVDFFDNEQEYGNEKYTCDDVRGLHPMDYWEVAELLNGQQATIQELERKLKKYAKIGDEQLRQIIDLQDELNECRARPTPATDERSG